MTTPLPKLSEAQKRELKRMCNGWRLVIYHDGKTRITRDSPVEMLIVSKATVRALFETGLIAHKPNTPYYQLTDLGRSVVAELEKI